MKYLRNGLFGVVTVGCLLFGGMKLVGVESMLQNMANLHYPEWFTRFLGLGEVSLAILIWIPVFRLPALVLLFGIFSGAIGSHLGHGDVIGSILPASVFLILTTLLFGFQIHSERVQTA